MCKNWTNNPILTIVNLSLICAKDYDMGFFKTNTVTAVTLNTTTYCKKRHKIYCGWLYEILSRVQKWRFSTDKTHPLSSSEYCMLRGMRVNYPTIQLPTKFKEYFGAILMSSNAPPLRFIWQRVQITRKKRMFWCHWQCWSQHGDE